VTRWKRATCASRTQLATRRASTRNSRISG
jgi:hypothetical protein